MKNPFLDSENHIFLIWHQYIINKACWNYYIFSLPRLQCFVRILILFVLARFRPNFLISAHLGAYFRLIAMSFTFSPAFFLDPIKKPDDYKI